MNPTIARLAAQMWLAELKAREAQFKGAVDIEPVGWYIRFGWPDPREDDPPALRRR